jgi:transposase InsO family protein
MGSLLLGVLTLVGALSGPGAPQDLSIMSHIGGFWVNKGWPTVCPSLCRRCVVQWCVQDSAAEEDVARGHAAGSWAGLNTGKPLLHEVVQS